MLNTIRYTTLLCPKYFQRTTFFMDRKGTADPIPGYGDQLWGWRNVDVDSLIKLI